METPDGGPDSGQHSNPHSSMHWSQERLHADVARAVGGSLNLIREISRISHELDPEMPTEWMVKRTQFFAYELQSELPHGLSEREKLDHLNRFFFELKRFKCLADTTSLQRPSDAFRVSRVLAARKGAPLVLSLIYAFLAEKIGVQLEFVDFNPAWFLRWSENGRSRYIDVARAGATLSSEELIEVLHSRYRMFPDVNEDTLFEPLSFERLLVAYLNDLKLTVAGVKGAHLSEPEKLLFLQNALMAYQPSNIQLFAERAVIHRRLGHYKNALSDLKRYFTFNAREKAMPELIQLHDDLVKILERTKLGLDDLDH
ncbi:MAG: hypothetical protein EOP05_05510 [Proteobacteria bacterium]|nr:MAG: hypothetical protein EOP05_05510 [Pseudomonadota bacterium]